MMLDFMVVSTRSTKRGTIEIYPKFLIKKSTDLMIRGGDFYAMQSLYSMILRYFRTCSWSTGK